jgi:L-amino acid N-acyltransferase YncA
VTKAWKRKGLSRIILQKLAEVAKDSGIDGLVAYTSLNNKPMIGLFKTLPYRVKLTAEDDMVDLVCRFNDPM